MKYWVGQKVHLGFSITFYGKIPVNFLANTVDGVNGINCKGIKSGGPKYMLTNNYIKEIEQYFTRQGRQVR